MNEKKWIKILAYLVMLVIAIGGPVLAYHQFNKEDIKDVDSYEKDDDYEDEYEDDDEVDVDDEDDEEDESIITNLDPLVEKTTFIVTKQNRIDLIKSTDCDMCMNEFLIGEMYKDKISDNFKLLYTALVLTQEIENTFPESMCYGELTISADYLLKNAQKIFKDVKIPENFNINLYYYGIHSLSCTNGECSFGRDTFGAMGVTPVIGYASKITEQNNSIKVNKIYVKEEDVDYDSETDISISDIQLYEDYNGKLHKELQSYELDLSKEVNVFEEFSNHFENLPTYIYTFDSENRLVSVTKE